MSEEIIQAVFNGDIKKLNEILESNQVDLNSIRNSLGVPLLHIAAANRDADMVTALLDHGVDQNAQNADNATALDYAFINADHVVARILIERGGIAQEAAAPANNIVFNNYLLGNVVDTEETEHGGDSACHLDF